MVTYSARIISYRAGDKREKIFNTEMLNTKNTEVLVLDAIPEQYGPAA